eukprot:138855-Pyramimonas_sp.AAC.1
MRPEAGRHHSSTMVSTAEMPPRPKPSVGACDEGRFKACGAAAGVRDKAGKRGCSTCRELSRPTAPSSTNLQQSTEFNENALLEEAEVMLSDDAPRASWP